LPDWIQPCPDVRVPGRRTTPRGPDNLRSAVSRAYWYDPDPNPTCQEIAGHYGTGILPTRPAKPREKAKVEAGVLAERLVLAPLRNHTFLMS